MDKIKETDLGKEAVRYFSELGYECFQEVTTHNTRIDLVIRKDNRTHGIELKCTFGLKVLEQAYDNKDYLDYSSIFVPKINSSFGKKILKDYGIGCFILGGNRGSLYETLKPELNVNKKCFLRLLDEQKTFSEAGNNTGSFWSDFKSTRRNIVTFLLSKKNNSYELNKLVKEVKNHYSSHNSFKTVLFKLVRNGIIKELEIIDNIVFLKKGYNLENLFGK